MIYVFYSTILFMITRLLNNRIGVYLFSIAKGVSMAELPQIEFPTKPKPKED